MKDRIRFEQTDHGHLIKIRAYKDEGKQKILTVWLIAWTLCGFAILSQLFVDAQEDMRSMLLVFAAFWLYFEYKVIKVFRWRREGEEQLLIGKETVSYGRTYSNRGFLKPYRKDMVNAMRRVDHEENKFSATMLDSYWVIGQEQLAFSVSGKVIYLGMHLTDKQSDKIIKFFNKHLS